MAILRFNTTNNRLIKNADGTKGKCISQSISKAQMGTAAVAITVLKLWRRRLTADEHRSSYEQLAARKSSET